MTARGNPYAGEAYKGQRKDEAYQRTTKKTKKVKDYKAVPTVVEQVRNAKDLNELNQMRTWFESPKNQMSGPVEKRWCEAWKERHKELLQETSRQHALRSISNQT